MFKEKRDIERTDEDHIIVDGVKLKAEERSRNFCDGCFFYNGTNKCTVGIYEDVTCTPYGRKDKQFVKWVKDIDEEKNILLIEVPDGYEIDQKNSTFERIVFKEKHIGKSEDVGFPRSWEEFCETQFLEDTEYFINAYSSVVKRSCKPENYRHKDTDKNLLPSKELAEAMLALCQLIQLRDCYNQGWEPDWTNDVYDKFCIETFDNKIQKETSCGKNIILAFREEEIRDEFYNNFKDLIEIAKPLL